jgi:hypothetical protein
MEELTKILDKIKFGTISVKLAQQQILDLLKISVLLPDKTPILIGHLNRAFGYNGFNKIEIGTPVYLFEDKYYFEMISVNGGKAIIQKFCKETLAPCINFINNEPQQLNID